MNTSDLYKLFRSDVVDEEKPYLWQDWEVFAYMDDAQTMFCRHGFGIADATTEEVVLVPIVAGEEWADVHESILTIRKAELVSTNRPLDIRDINDAGTTEDDYGVIFNASTEHRPGVVRGIVVGEEYNKARWVGVPVADDTARLTVYRLPLVQITGKDQELELRREHHYALLDWMKARAYGKQDAETFDRARAQECENRFMAYCEKARKEWERYKHKPRAIKYGGIGGLGAHYDNNYVRRPY